MKSWGGGDSWGQVADFGRSHLGPDALAGACPVPAALLALARNPRAKILRFGGAGS